MKTYVFESTYFWEYAPYDGSSLQIKSYVCNELGGVFVSDIDPIKDAYGSVLWELGLEDDKYNTDEDFWDWIDEIRSVGNLSKYCKDVHNFHVVIKESEY